MFATTRQLMQQLDWSPYLENTGANFNEGGEYQMSNPDPDGLVCVCVCVCVCMCVCATARVRLCDHVLAWSSRGHTRSRSRSPSLALVRVRLLSLSLSLSHFLHLTLHLSHCQGPASNVADRSFKEHNMASAWNGVSTYTRAGSRIARSLTHAFRHT